MKVLVLFAMIVALVSTGMLGCQSVTGRTAGQLVDDGTITTTVKGKLVRDQRLGGMRINVDTHQGNVTLSGLVPDKETEQRAIEMAKETNGVRSVRSNLLIEGQTTPAGATKTDTRTNR
jgi:osmotically-inducible protein OsmY